MPKKNKNVACTIQYGRYEINIGHVVAIGESSCGFWQERRDLSVVDLWQERRDLIVLLKL
jgi:hypothetical protein